MAKTPVQQQIARNIRRLRLANGWTQELAGEVFDQFGYRWSKASWSAAESTTASARPRPFTCDEIAALAELFNVRPGDLFEEFACPRCAGSPPAGFICAACFTRNDDTGEQS